MWTMCAKEEIESFIKHHTKLYIYGAGVLGRALADLLRDMDIVVAGFIVSDGENHASSWDGIPVFCLSEYLKSYHEDGCGIFISLSPYYRNEIEQSLRSKEIDDYLWVDKTSFQEIIRKLHPVSPENFLKTIEPISRAYGSERGKPIDRFYVEQFLQDSSRRLIGVKRIIEVGEDKYSRMYFGGGQQSSGKDCASVQFDVLRYDLGMDLTKPETLPANQYDVFICTQVFNFIYDVKAAIRGAFQLLKPGGTMLATVMGPIAQISRNDMRRWGDYWRFTDLSIKMLVAEAFGESNVEVFPFGNALVATAWVQGLALEDLADKSVLAPVDPTYAINIGVIAKKGKK